MSLTEANLAFKPFQYPWAYDAWKMQQQIHWMPEEVPLGEDLKDWRNKLSDKERNLLTQIFRYFTQSDVEVQDNYMEHYARIFKPTEVKMMLASFANMETIHIAAYALLLETIGMDDSEFTTFMDIPEMKAKHDYTRGFNVDTPYEVAKTLAVFGAFMEGLSLYGMFAMLMNFPRHNKMKGMGQIVSWSVRDESLHSASIIRLYHTWLDEHPEIDRVQLGIDLSSICRDMVEREDGFIDVAFELGDVEGLSSQEMKNYVRFIANQRCNQLRVPSPFKEFVKQPLPWLDSLLSGLELANFFEARATEYSKAATKGDWDDSIYE